MLAQPNKISTEPKWLYAHALNYKPITNLTNAKATLVKRNIKGLHIAVKKAEIKNSISLGRKLV